MKFSILFLMGITPVAFNAPLFAANETVHEHNGKEVDHEQSGGTHDQHGERGEEGNPSVGPEKGIVEASEEKGFKLSPEATKNFELQTLKLSGNGPWQVPLSSRLLAGEEVNLYRVRDGFYKRIDFKVVKKSSDPMTVSSPELRTGDEIATQGIGFLRIADLAAFGGMTHGHSH